jgi:RimJ/RimL family protein N-acetyltransferase
MTSAEIGDAVGEKEFRPLPVEYGRVRLRPVSRNDYDWLFRVESDPRLMHRWRLSGRTPAPEDYARLLWNGVLCQFVVEERMNNICSGLVACYEPEPFNGVAKLAFVSDPDLFRSGLLVDGMILFVDYVFRSWPFRKLYADSMEFNIAGFVDPNRERAEDHTDLFKIEGCMKDYGYFDGKYWDKYILSISREDWDLYRPSVFAQMDRHAEVG